MKKVVLKESCNVENYGGAGNKSTWADPQSPDYNNYILCVNLNLERMEKLSMHNDYNKLWKNLITVYMRSEQFDSVTPLAPIPEVAEDNHIQKYALRLNKKLTRFHVSITVGCNSDLINKLGQDPHSHHLHTCGGYGRC